MIGDHLLIICEWDQAARDAWDEAWDLAWDQACADERE